MWKRSIGIGLILFGALGSAIPLKNLWTISAAWKNWEDFERNSNVGFEFLDQTGVLEPLRTLWFENLITLTGFCLIAVIGIFVLIGPKLRFPAKL